MPQCRQRPPTHRPATVPVHQHRTVPIGAAECVRRTTLIPASSFHFPSDGTRLHVSMSVPAHPRSFVSSSRGAIQGVCRWCGGGRSGGAARAVGIRIVDAGASAECGGQYQISSRLDLPEPEMPRTRTRPALSRHRISSSAFDLLGLQEDLSLLLEQRHIVRKDTCKKA